MAESRIADGSNGNVAVDMYSKYKDDIKMMKSMGFDAYRFSISWSRILPGGRPCVGVNKEGIDYYNDLINTLLANGMEPYVTLFHHDLPQCLEQEYGGFLNKDRIVDGYGPNLMALSKQTKGSTKDSQSKWNPSKDPYTAARNMLVAHAVAVNSYRTKFQEHQEGKIGITLISHWYLEPELTGKYPQCMIDYVDQENLAQFNNREIELLKWSIDFLGLNYYTANYAANDPNPNVPEGYAKDQQIAYYCWLVVVVHSSMGDLRAPETCVDEKNDYKLTAYEACVDTMRVNYHRDHLANILKARNNDKVNVIGYFAWSWTDNFEWVVGYTVRFGLIYVDYMNYLTRYPKQSALWFAKFLANKKLLRAKNKQVEEISAEKERPQNAFQTIRKIKDDDVLLMKI
ncbi:hypothetical protein DH2020_025420 [Rehmannia glutinosa]|uniref:Beta-glucosidase n=1 Tax=Rehmannia glutinosa TaxID=99300 RepID=A0ABR0W445_REHGL